jgi:hypothetical protein
VAGLAGLLMYLVLTGAITRAVAAEVAGEDPSLEQSYRFGFHRLGAVLLVSVLVGLTTIAGLILFIIPGIYIGVRLAVSVEALVVEGRRGTQAMGRSWALVGGHWWHAFGALVVAGLLNAIITTPFNNTSWFVQAVAAAVATVITLPYGVLVGVLLYLDLRARKEALTLERLRTDLAEQLVAQGGVGVAQLGALQLDRPQRRLEGAGLLPAIAVALGHVLASTLVAAAAKLLADDLFDDALEGQPHRQPCDLLDDAQQLPAGLEQLMNLSADGLGGRYSDSHGRGSSFVSW